MNKLLLIIAIFFAADAGARQSRGDLSGGTTSRDTSAYNAPERGNGRTAGKARGESKAVANSKKGRAATLGAVVSANSGVRKIYETSCDEMPGIVANIVGKANGYCAQNAASQDTLLAEEADTNEELDTSLEINETYDEEEE